MLAWGFGTASVEEIVWVIVGVIALVYNVRTLRSSHADLQDVITSRRNGRYLRRANQLQRNELMRAVMQGALCLVGVVALFAPQPETVNIISRLMLWGLQWGLVYGAWRDSQDRDWLRLQDPGPAARLSAYTGEPPDEWVDPLEEFRHHRGGEQDGGAQA